MADETSSISNCISIGKIWCTSDSFGAIVGLINGTVASPIITGCYFIPECSNTIYSIGSDTYDTGHPASRGSRSIDELTSGVQSDWLFPDWSTDIWLFKEGVFPMLKIFGTIPAFCLAVRNVSSNLNANDKINLSWDAPLNQKALGYDVYLSADNVFTKLNTDLITDNEFIHEPTAPGSNKYCVNAIFSFKEKSIYAGQGEVVEEDYYLPVYAKVVDSEVWIADSRFPDNSTFYTKIGTAIAKEYDGIEEEIVNSDIVVVEGTKVGDWLGNGSSITRTYDDAKRTIIQIFTIEGRRIIIFNTVTYKTSIKIEYEGFEFTGHIAFNNKKNVFGSGSGQHIIDQTGMFFHNGNYTPHRSLSSEGSVNYLYKQYYANDQEWCKLYLMDGRDYSPIRILGQPNGYDSLFVIGNHPDGEIQKSRETVWLGSNNINDLAYGTKGLLARGIKADWSCFVNGILQWNVTADYKAFLHTIKNAGIEAIPHSLQVSNPVPRSTAITYLPIWKNEFAPSNWTDHSLGGAGNDTIGICSKGWDINDETYYAMDLFEENGFDKAWSYDDTDQDMLDWNMWGFDHHIVYINDHIKLPSGKSIKLWKSSDKPFYNGWMDINKLIKNCGAVNSHDYFAINGGASTRESLTGDTEKFSRTYYSTGDDNYRITKGFDAIIQEIANKKTLNQIWNPTITEWVDYFIQLKNVTIELVDENTSILTNTGNIISGFSVLICKKNVQPTINGAFVNYKSVNKGTICWFDFPTGEVVLTI